MAESVLDKVAQVQKGGKYMSLLRSEKHKCMLIVEASVPDGHGAEMVAYVGGAVFDAVITPTDSTNASKEVAENTVSSQKVKVMYPCGVPLTFGSVFKDLETEKSYKVTSKGDIAANAASIKRNVTYAEEWTVPNG